MKLLSKFAQNEFAVFTVLIICLSIVLLITMIFVVSILIDSLVGNLLTRKTPKTIGAGLCVLMVAAAMTTLVVSAALAISNEHQAYQQASATWTDWDAYQNGEMSESEWRALYGADVHEIAEMEGEPIEFPASNLSDCVAGKTGSVSLEYVLLKAGIAAKLP